MNTPIADFVKTYAEKDMSRLHMPGHKGRAVLGFEQYDITEVSGADALYEADGIIAESEANATSLFGTARSVYSTEGSSQCIRAMLYLAVNRKKFKKKPVIIAARNVHKTFIYAAALLDIDIVWLWPEGKMNSLCSCPISTTQLENELMLLEEAPAAVYLTSPDYLGNQQDIEALAHICHKNDTILLVDNAHGAYLHFMKESTHPMDLGADMCCDSAHKTLPVLTGGAYLHIGGNAPKHFASDVKDAMALFGSTSPSYLILASLDMCNRYLCQDYKKKLAMTCQRVEELKMELRELGWHIEKTDPLKMTVHVPENLTGVLLAERLRLNGIECEYSDDEYLVFMFTPENKAEDFERIKTAIGMNYCHTIKSTEIKPVKTKQMLSVRDAIFSRHEKIRVEEALGRICGSPSVSCPPAIPIVISGEIINEDAIRMFQFYHIEWVDVILINGKE